MGLKKFFVGRIVTDRISCYHAAYFQTSWQWLESPKGSIGFEVSGDLRFDFVALRSELELADFRLPTWLVLWEPLKEKYRAYLGYFGEIGPQKWMASDNWVGINFLTKGPATKVGKDFEQWNPWEAPDWRPLERMPEDYYAI